MANPARAYLATQVETTTQGELLLMLYEAAIKFLKRAKIEIDNKDFARKGIYISKAMAIIHELTESLNKEKGGEITPRLGALYQFCTSQLIKANIRLDKKMIDDVIKILDGIRSAYAQIVPTMDGKAAPGDKQSISKAAAPHGSQIPQVPQAQAPPVVPQAQTAPPIGAQQPVQAQAQTQQGAKQTTAAPKPAPVQPAIPPKLRSATNAAKFRAANAYNTNNR
jgi:flagellar protein FliS